MAAVVQLALKELVCARGEVPGSWLRCGGGGKWKSPRTFSLATAGGSCCPSCEGGGEGGCEDWTGGGRARAGAEAGAVPRNKRPKN